MSESVQTEDVHFMHNFFMMFSHSSLQGDVSVDEFLVESENESINKLDFNYISVSHWQ